jgi:hypothetical protein
MDLVDHLLGLKGLDIALLIGQQIKQAQSVAGQFPVAALARDKRRQGFFVYSASLTERSWYLAVPLHCAAVRGINSKGSPLKSSAIS